MHLLHDLLETLKKHLKANSTVIFPEVSKYSYPVCRMMQILTKSATFTSAQYVTTVLPIL